MDHSDNDVELSTIRQAEDTFMVLGDLPLEGADSSDDPVSLSDSQSLSSDSSYLNIDPDDELDDEDIDDSTESISSEEQQAQHELEEVDVDAPEQSPSEDDLCSSIPTMYRILDLICERGTSGLVDKIIIAQDSLKHFLNEISPGTYMSLTKVDFKALDKFRVKPIGIYGSKNEIARFLASVGVIDDTMAAKLVEPADSKATEPTLRSGLYICRASQSTGTAEKIYVLYWPEETTWQDDASTPVRRNRVTFMRYLTKICDQNFFPSYHVAPLPGPRKI